MSEKTVRHLHLVGATGEIRTAEYNGSTHLVVPVVAMVEGVVWASNSEVPEFVPAEELAQTPQQWNGRGAFAGHPKDGGTQVTANTPRTLEKSFGTIFDTAPPQRILKTRRLEFNVFVDPEKAKAIGPAEEAVVNRLLAGERVEVSVGAYVEAEDKDGIFDGKEYHGVWHNIVSDHIAFLAEGEEGACSVAAGCGAPRAAIRHLVTAQGIQREDKMDKPKAGATREEILEYLQARIAVAGQSDRDVRSVLDSALRAIEPGYMGIDAVYLDDKEVIYYVMPGEEWQTKRRSFSLSKDGKEATLKDDAVEVKADYQVTYSVVGASKKVPSNPTKLKASGDNCGCSKGVKNMADKATRAELIAALTTNNPFSGFVEADTAMLESASDARLEEFRSAADTRKTQSESLTRLENDLRHANARLKIQDDKLRAASEGMSEEEWIAKAPPKIKALLEREKAADDMYRGSIIVQLKDLGKHTEEQLKAMSTEDLEMYAGYANVTVPDFSAARQVPRALTKNSDINDYAPPDSYGLRAKKQVAVQ